MRQDAVTRDRCYGPLTAKRSEGRRKDDTLFEVGPKSAVLVCHIAAVLMETVAYSWF